MLTFGLVSSKVCITYSRCPCKKLWGHLKCLNIQTIEVNRSSTKQLLNNFWGDFLEKLKQFSGRGSKMDCLQKRGAYSSNGDKTIIQSIRITSRSPSKIRKWNQLYQFRLV